MRDGYVLRLRDEIQTGTRPRHVRQLTPPTGLSVVVLAPHPDDFDIVAVTLRYLREQGNTLHVCVLTSGASGVEDRFCSPPTNEVKAALREEEQKASCRIFGLPEPHLTFLRLREDDTGHLVEGEENMRRVETYLASRQPDIVFLPHGNDTNVDHQRVYAMLKQLAPELGRPVAAFYNHDPKTIAMRYDVVSDYDEEAAQWKARMLRCHASQHQRNLNTRGHGLDDRILEADRQAGREALNADTHVEAFELEFMGLV